MRNLLPLVVLLAGTGIGRAEVVKRARMTSIVRCRATEHCPDQLIDGLRALEGVKKAAFDRGSSKVSVDYDPDEQSQESLTRYMRNFECAEQAE